MGHKLDNQIKKAPQKPGIYIFKNKAGEFLYIGKAGNLKNRVRQYLRPDAKRPFLEHLMNEAERIDLKTTTSEIEALILESNLIKEKQPKYNVALRDGKRHFYVSFSNDDFPKVFIAHQPTKFGPFTDGTALRTTMKLLRRIFQYCTCLTARDPAKRDKQRHNNFCLNYHIGKCLGICCLKQQSRNFQFSNSLPSGDLYDNFQKISNNYKRNIKAIKDILSGKKVSLIKRLKKELDVLVKNEDFEKAIELRNKIGRLEKVFENAKIIRDAEAETETTKQVLERFKETFRLPRFPGRIEGYDISNIQGKNAVGAMVVFTAGRPDKDEYRKFKIYFKETPDDTAMLKEVLLRRFNHPEWPKPDLLFIDGGKGQLNAAKNVAPKNTSIISLAKGKREVFSTVLEKPVPMKKLSPEVRNLVLHIDSEAHRFAVSYYRKVHRREIMK